MSTPRIVQWVLRHGGIRQVRTHPLQTIDRRTGRPVQRWANTIICRDGATKRLTLGDEERLQELPEEMRAEEHIIVES